jgi:hypothetical protein
VSAITVAVTFASSAPSYAVEAFQEDFGESAEVSYLILTLFLAGFITSVRLSFNLLLYSLRAPPAARSSGRPGAR